jgi:ATP phosphoribosyltransferase regulatory subunit
MGAPDDNESWIYHPVPDGTRDVLPEEMGELRELENRLLASFGEGGYREVATPVLEYEHILAHGPVSTTNPAYKLLDENGEALVLRSDMTLPIARLIASRFAAEEPPFRLCYATEIYRRVTPGRGHPRQMRHAGVELIGVPAPEGTAEVLTVLTRAPAAAGLDEYAIVLGDARFYGRLLGGLGVGDGDQRRLYEFLERRDFVGLEAAVAELGLSADDAELAVSVPRLRGGPELLDGAPGPLADAIEKLRAVHEAVDPGVAGRVIFDLGAVSELGYYTGAVLQVLHRGSGTPIGGGGRYDSLLERFGRPLPAVGFSVDLTVLHSMLVGQAPA